MGLCIHIRDEMQHQQEKTMACLALCGVLVLFLTKAGAVRAAAAEALGLCARSVIPALFPFLVVSSLLLSLGLGDLTVTIDQHLAQLGLN